MNAITRIGRRSVRLRLAVLSLAVGLSASSALAFDKAQIFSGNIAPTLLYLGDPTYEWFIPGTDPGTYTMLPFNGSPWTIMSASLSWTGSELDQDLSAGGVADGTFLPGGSFSISGTIPAAGVFSSTVVFEGTVSAFRAKESLNDPNKIEFLGHPGVNDGVLITPTGGWLYDNNRLLGEYFFDAQGILVSQDGDNLVDFQSSIAATAGSQFLLVSNIPEPTTGLLLVLGLVPLLRRRGVGGAR